MFGSFNRHNRTGAEAVFTGLVRSVVSRCWFRHLTEDVVPSAFPPDT